MLFNCWEVRMLHDKHEIDRMEKSLKKHGKIVFFVIIIAYLICPTNLLWVWFVGMVIACLFMIIELSFYIPDKIRYERKLQRRYAEMSKYTDVDEHRKTYHL